MTLKEKFEEYLNDAESESDIQIYKHTRYVASDLAKITQEGQKVIAEGVVTFIGGLSEYCIQDGDRIIRTGSIFIAGNIQDIEGKKVKLILEVQE